MNLIVSADRDWGIGKQGQLLFRAPGDMAFFRRMTLAKTVVMGRKTLESLPEGKPLPGRDNIVLTRDRDYSVQGAGVCHSGAALAALVSDCEGEDVFVIGGEQVYRLLLPYCGRAYVTRWEAAAPADSFFPDLDASENWCLEERSEPVTEKGLTYRFCTYAGLRTRPLSELEFGEEEGGQ